MYKKKIYNNINPPKRLLERQQRYHDITRGEEKIGCIGDFHVHFSYGGATFLPMSYSMPH
jgi:hypothetical protein